MVNRKKEKKNNTNINNNKNLEGKKGKKERKKESEIQRLVHVGRIQGALTSGKGEVSTGGVR